MISTSKTFCFNKQKPAWKSAQSIPNHLLFRLKTSDFPQKKRWNRPKKAWNHLQKEPDCRTLVHCKQTILPACDKTKNRNENHPTERKRRESDTEHDRLRHLPTENQNGDQTQPVSTFRQQLRYCLPGKRCNEADRLPKYSRQPNSARRTVSAR